MSHGTTNGTNIGSTFLNNDTYVFVHELTDDAYGAYVVRGGKCLVWSPDADPAFFECNTSTMFNYMGNDDDLSLYNTGVFQQVSARNHGGPLYDLVLVDYACFCPDNCPDATEGTVEGVDLFGYGAKVSVLGQTVTVYQGGFGYTNNGPVNLTLDSDPKIKCQALSITAKVVIQPYSADNSDVEVSGAELLNISELTGVTGSPIIVESSPYHSPFAIFYLAAKILLGIFIVVVFVIFIVLTVYGTRIRRQIIAKEKQN
jgi:hypothetical protein